MNINSMFIGRHLLADLHGVSENYLIDPTIIENLLNEAAVAANATPIFGKFHHFGESSGVTGMLLLKESHISIHTWPEFSFAAIDIFMCGNCKPEKALELIKNMMQPHTINIKNIDRGNLIMTCTAN